MSETAVTSRVGEICAGYGGMYLALQMAGYNVDLSWYAEKDPDASAVMAHHHADVDNLGDITAVDWGQAEPVDIITAGYPCQSFSNAGLRKGFADERAVWPHVADAVRDLRPRLVLLENVAGHLARGFGRVLGDLAALGYDAEWLCIRASDLGAPHRRERVFIAAYPADADRLHPAVPTPRASDGAKGGPNQRGSSGDLALPAAVQPERLLPTPTVADSRGTRNATAGRTGSGHHDGWTLSDVAYDSRWGQYDAAITRWEQVTGRPAPEPTEPGRTGKPRLSPRFVEWMMGLPEGHVTGIVDRNAALRVLGNGLVPAQGALAFRSLEHQRVFVSTG